MLTVKQRRSVTRALIKAYYSYRDLSLFKICRTAGISVYVNHDEPLGGHAGKAYVEIPGKCPKFYKEHVFWHEFCHTVVERLGFYSRLIGYQGHLQQFDADGGYWIWERICEAFADLMMLYRHLGVETKNVEAFLFEDCTSIGYAEVVRFSVTRTTKHCDEAAVKGRNIDLSDMKRCLKHQERFISNSPHQQMLPTAFREHHQTPWPSFVDEQADSLGNEKHSGKKSWRLIHPKEREILSKIESLKNFHAQLSLFETITAANRRKFERRLNRLDRIIKRF